MKAIYFSGLNGLRAIAALAVVISHTTLALGDFNLNYSLIAPLLGPDNNGWLLAGHGVTIFFVLSGFLITFLLLSEKDLQDIDIKKFYVRRILRIWPLYYLYFIICVGLIWYDQQSLPPNTILFYVFYAANIPFIIGSSLPYLSHYWSLGVEEQFYLFWPLVIKKVNKHLMVTIISLIFLLLSSKILFHFYCDNPVFSTGINVTRFHCMMIGALGALLYKQKHFLF